MYIVDTNVVSEARRGTPAAVQWLRSIPRHSAHLSVLTLGEIARGIGRKARRDPESARHLSEWLSALRHDYAPNILPITDEIALEWGRLASQRARGEIDGLLAATAILHELVLVTRNVADFEDTGVGLLDPWNLERN